MNQIDQKRVSAGKLSPRFQPKTPFLVEGCIVMLCDAGWASFSLDFRIFRIMPGDMVLLFNDMAVELIDRSEDFKISYVSVSEESAFEVCVEVTSGNFWQKIYTSPLIRPKEKYGFPAEEWMKESLFVAERCAPHTASTLLLGKVSALFRILQELIEESADEPEDAAGPAIWKVMTDFFILLSRNYTSEHKVEFYARKLGISSDYLSVIIRRTTRMSPKQTIESRIVLAAKAMLENSAMPVRAIAEKLNYEDTSHFCRVFRRNAGISPLKYRNANMTSKAGES